MIFLDFIFIIKLKNKFQVIISIFNKNWKMNFVFIFFESFSLPKCLTNQSSHLNYTKKPQIFSSIFDFFKNRKEIPKFDFSFNQILKFKSNFWISFFFLIVKLNFRIFIKIISKSDIYFRPRLFFQLIAVKVWARDFGLRKILWVVFIFLNHSYNSNG